MTWDTRLFRTMLANSKLLARNCGRASDLLISLGFLALLCLVALITWHSASRLLDLIDASDEARRAETVLQRLDQAARQVTEAERQQRTYIITSDASYLTLYDQSLAKVRDSFDELLKLTHGQRLMRSLIAQSKRRIDERLSIPAFALHSLRLYQQYLDLEQIASAQPASADIRAGFAQVEQHFVQSLETARTRFDDARREVRSSFTWLAMTAATLVLVMAVAVRLERRHTRRLSVELLHKSRHDDLTGLPNRAYLTESLDRAIAHAQRKNHKVALLFLDLNGFKAVNDTFGHKAGDEVLTEFSKIIRALSRAGDLVARLGGDEFAVIIPQATEIAELEKAAERFRSVSLARKHLAITASVGIAVYPDDAPDADGLIKSSDAAMYQQKRAQRTQGGQPAG
jgi:diguanylate cyclase (GGDEF)-like protein